MIARTPLRRNLTIIIMAKQEIDSRCCHAAGMDALQARVDCPRDRSKHSLLELSKKEEDRCRLSMSDKFRTADKGDVSMFEMEDVL